MNAVITRIQELIEQSPKNATQILKDLRMSTSALSDWKKKDVIPSTSAIIRFSKYFNVSADYLLFGIGKDKQILSPKENEWLKIFYDLSDAERGIFLDLTFLKNSFQAIDVNLIDLLDSFQQLSPQNRKTCLSFINWTLHEQGKKNQAEKTKSN